MLKAEFGPAAPVDLGAGARQQALGRIQIQETTAEMPVLAHPGSAPYSPVPPSQFPPRWTRVWGTRRSALAARAGIIHHTCSLKHLSVLLRERNLNVTINMRLFMCKILAVT